MDKLDSNLAELDSLEADAKKHSMKKWIVEKKAIHEIKKIAHEAGKYETYDEKRITKRVGRSRKIYVRKRRFLFVFSLIFS